MQNWAVRAASEVEQNIVSVERIQQYIELEPEAPYELPDSKPTEELPLEGRLEFKYGLNFLFSPVKMLIRQITGNTHCVIGQS